MKILKKASSVVKAFILIAVTMSIANCSQNRIVKQPPTDSSIAFYGTYLFVDQCHNKVASGQSVRALEGLGAEIAGSLATSIVKTGIDWIGSALQRAAEDDVERTTVSANLISLKPISRPDSQVCLQVVRGHFKYAKKAKNTYSNPFSIDSAKRTVAPLEVVAGSEEVFIEILPIIHEQVVSFTPLEVRYSGYTPSDRRSKRARDLAIFVGYTPISHDVYTGNYSGRLINFGTLIPGANKQATQKYISDDGKLSLVGQTQWLGLSDAIKNSPFTLAVNVIETRQASKFSKFLASAFNSSKEDIKNQAASAVSELEVFKSRKALEKERVELEKEKLQHEQEYLEVEATVIAREDTLSLVCAANNSAKAAIYKAQKDLYLAKMSANIASALAGKNRPYPQASLRSPTGRCR